MDTTQSIEETRRRFARSLVGHWSTAAGTSSAVMDQKWDIRPDGTGAFTDTGPFGHPCCETRFEWRQPDERVFELRLVVRVAPQPGGEPEPPLDDDERQWQSVSYDFVAVATDTGHAIGLIDMAQAGRPHAGFLNSLAPLVYRSSASKAQA